MTSRAPQPLVVAALTLAVTLAAPAAARDRAGATPVPIEGIERVNRALLPRLGGPISIHVHAIDATIVLEAPRAVRTLVRALRLSPLAVCPDLDETASGVVLRCRSRRIVAHLSRAGTGYVLDVAETRGLPWDGEDGAPIIPFDPVPAGLGDKCPGSTPAGRAECLLGRSERSEAQAVLAAATGTAAEEATALRRGDLAYAEGDVLAATSWWSRTRGRIWEKLAAARLCELSWACITTSRLEDVYAPPDLPAWAAQDLHVRHARALAFLARPGPAAERLVSSLPALAGCAFARSLCRDVAGAALVDPGPRSLDGLALWLSIPEPERNPAVYRATEAAAAVAEREGAPIFAANLLASAAGQVPTRLLREHLLRTAELYVDGGDVVRAGVVVEFARNRAGDSALAGPRWAAVTRAVRARPPSQGRAP